MTSHQSVALGVRLFVIWLCTYLIRSFPSIHIAFKDNTLPTTSLMIILGAIFAVLIFLWSFPTFVASKLLSEQSLDANESSNYDSWFDVGSVLIGIWLIADAIPSLVQYLALKFLLAHTLEPPVGMPEKWTAILIADTTEMLFGIFLLYFGGSVQVFIRKLRGH